MIKEDLNIASNVVSQVEGWFASFFVNGGINAILGQNTTFVIESENGEMTNITTGSGSSSVVLEVSDQVESIVAWITANFNQELSSILSQYNITFTSGMISAQVNSTEANSTMNSTNSTSGNNGTVVDTNSTLNGSNSTNSSSNNNGTEVNSTTGTGSGNTGVVDLFVNYTLPSSCVFTDATNDTVRCSSGNSRGVTFTIAQVSEYFNTTALEVCSDYTTAASSCTSNTVITDFNTCLRLSLYNQFQLAQETVIYGWLSYDVVARNTLFGRCEAQNNGFNGTSANFSTGFTFDFPNIN